MRNRLKMYRLNTRPQNLRVLILAIIRSEVDDITIIPISCQVNKSMMGANCPSCVSSNFTAMVFKRTPSHH